MGFLFRVRAASFFAGSAATSIAAFYILGKDYNEAHDAIQKKVKGAHETLDNRLDVLEKRITTLENLKEAKTSEPVEASD